MYACIYTYNRATTYTRMHAYIVHTHIHACTHEWMHVCMYGYIHSLSSRNLFVSHTHIHIEQISGQKELSGFLSTLNGQMFYNDSEHDF